MVSLATLDDLKSHLQDSIVDAAAGQLALDNASAIVRAYCRWPIAPAYTETLTVDSDGGQIIQLPCLNVTAVTEVLIDGEAITDYTFSAAGMLARNKAIFPIFSRIIDGFITGGFPIGFQRVTVSYNGGYDTIPEELRAVVLDAASRQYLNPGGYASETIGGYTYQFPAVRSGPLAGTAGGLMLTTQETRIVDRYRIGRSP